MSTKNFVFSESFPCFHFALLLTQDPKQLVLGDLPISHPEMKVLLLNHPQNRQLNLVLHFFQSVYRYQIQDRHLNLVLHFFFNLYICVRQELREKGCYSFMLQAFWGGSLNKHLFTTDKVPPKRYGNCITTGGRE